MLPQTVLAWSLKSWLEKVMGWAVILYALRHKENVAAKFSNGQFEIVATGSSEYKRIGKP